MTTKNVRHKTDIVRETEAINNYKMAEKEDLLKIIFGEEDDSDDPDLDKDDNDLSDNDDTIYGLLKDVHENEAVSAESIKKMNIKKISSAKEAGFEEYRPSKKNRGKNSSKAQNTEEEPEDERIVNKRKIELKIDSISKKGSGGLKRRKKEENGESLSETGNADKNIQNLLRAMEEACIADIEANGNKEFSGAKMKLLPMVEAEFTKQSWDTLMDFPILGTIKGWLFVMVNFFRLEPLPDFSLPALDIQKAMMKALNHLPINTKEPLENSGIGKIVKFYTLRKGVNPEVKRKAQDLIDKWTRIITHRTDDYSHRNYQTGRVDKLIKSSVDDERPRESGGIRARIPNALAPGFSLVPESVSVDKSKR
ncbi:Transcription factor iws1 [Nowakowskiella sp. JEL0078]|nr:Transcription factor iws1 [Nowakowskiella sp. JEL0078]